MEASVASVARVVEVVCFAGCVVVVVSITGATIGGRVVSGIVVVVGATVVVVGSGCVVVVSGTVVVETVVVGS